MNYANSFKDLEVYKLSREMAKDIFFITKNFPTEEKYSLTDQIRRSSRSVGAQIAEAWGKRRYEKHFISILTDADSEQFETQHWLEVSWENEYITEQVKNQITEKSETVGKMLNSMINKASQFCNPSGNFNNR
ncbi:MAG: four helix bundle protein [Prolixibacteraceae bacterium]|nr:four helix bundle protein [Prolixibacteraceae bacterium]